jgi:hypothetical protein
LLFSCTNKREINEYYPDGALRTTYTVINGIKEGKYTEFRQSGEIGIEYFFKDGFEHGPVTAYYKNGNIAHKGQLVWGIPVGSNYYYNENNKLDSIVEYILLQENETFFEYLERDTITKEIAQSAFIQKNAIIIFDKNGIIDMGKSLYYEISFDTIVHNDMVRFYLSFSNPCEYEVYNCDSIEIITYVNCIADKETTHKILSSKNAIHLTGVHKRNKGRNVFYAIIILHYKDGKARPILIKVPFETGNFENVEKRWISPAGYEEYKPRKIHY